MLQDVNEIISIIGDNSKEAYLVGGAVRDMVIGKTPHDFDIATNMSYEDLEKVFPKNYPSGKAFGIITIFYNGSEYEIAHFRTDGDYEDGRHCDVKLIENIEDDLKRRDLTINAMAWSEKTGIIDPFGGKKDIENQIIRCVGNPDERFKEDALRMIRAIRFSAQLGFDIEKDTFDAISKNAELIKNVSLERIRVEILKILGSDNPEMIKLLYDTGLSKYFMPELDDMFKCEQNNPNHIFNVGLHSIETIANCDDTYVRLAALLHDVAKPHCKTAKDGVDHFYDHAIKSSEMASVILRRLKFSNEERDIVRNLIAWHDTRIKKLAKVRAAVAKLGIDFFDKLYELQKADIFAQSDFNRQEKLDAIEELNDAAHKVFDDKTAIKMTDLKIDGSDLIGLGFSGKEIGAILNDLYVNCLGTPELNDREKLLKRVQNYKTQTLEEIIDTYCQKKDKIVEENPKFNEIR